ncbi:MAG: 7TM diverse intracellular signaling domain-containing protein [Bacteroidota bacterium]
MKLRISIVFIVLFVSAYCQGYCSTAVIRGTDNIIRLTGWQYYTGNDTTAEVKSINTIRLSDKWAGVSSPYNIPKNNRSGIIWLRTKLPFRRGADAAVYIGQISNSMQVFLEGELIYQCGSFCPEGDKYMRWNQGLIRLPFYKNGAELYFQIRTGKEVSRIVDKSLFGSSLEITRNMFNHNAVNYIFLTIIFPSAIISLIIFFTLQRTKMLFGLAIFLISTGVIIACNTAFFQLIFNSPSVFYHMNYISCNMAPVSFYYLMEQVVLDKYKIIINALWKVKLALLIIVFIILEITSLIFYDIAKYFMLFNSVCLVIGMTVLVLSIRKSSYSSKVFIIGMSGILLSLMLEFIFLFSEGFASGFREYLKVFHFGAVIFVATIIWLVMHNYREADRERENIRRKEIDAIKRENETRHHFAAKLLESQEIERNRIALELHDSVGQKLLLIKNKLPQKSKIPRTA